MNAQMVCNALIAAGIEAVMSEDISGAGVRLGGLNPSIVWIERADAERAQSILEEYDSRPATRRQRNETGGPIEVVCEECGKRSTFRAAENGTVQHCSHCRAYVDVGGEPEIEGWDDTPGEEEAKA
ncbi:hypothetical protein FRUB_08575 [Fimbriiglobus ruber]|uniref:Uncharacterized protein n=2 Tax=Fimbriiglobus ruber TaxID=1908690 RepID=A0A225D3D0_9BACT|nr:hypothetical protein FRUB_08575 [Fimbriiglobus ruber]